MFADIVALKLIVAAISGAAVRSLIPEPPAIRSAATGKEGRQPMARVFFDHARPELTDPGAHSTLQVTIEAHCPTAEREVNEGAARPDGTTEVAEVDGK